MDILELLDSEIRRERKRGEALKRLEADFDALGCAIEAELHAEKIADEICELGGYPTRCICPDDSGSCQWCRACCDALSGHLTEADVEEVRASQKT